MNSTLKNESVDTSGAKFRVREVENLTSAVRGGRRRLSGGGFRRPRWWEVWLGGFCCPRHTDHENEVDRRRNCFVWPESTKIKVG